MARVAESPGGANSVSTAEHAGKLLINASVIALELADETEG